VTADELLVCVQDAVWRHRPADGREARARHQTLVALGRLANPFDRHADPTHVTGSALILGPGGILLHRHKRLHMWLQPGGHLDPGETPWDAARREGEEETGLRLAWPEDPDEEASRRRPGGGPPLVHLDVHAGGRGHTHLDLRYPLVVCGPDEPHPPAGESQDVRWFNLEDAAAVADDGLAGFLRFHLTRGSVTPKRAELEPRRTTRSGGEQ
jgi:8-oxo-dGTP pyrophosphatase MutT (NUDIX family)